jgi:saccharopine dehydrogenase (NAD+, L-lysine-forming)
VLIWLVKLSRLVQPLLGLSPVQTLLRLCSRALPPGPDDARRARSRSDVWGEVRDDEGHTATLRLAMAGGYTLTVLTTLDIVQRVLGGHAPIGFQTPSRAYGSELIFGIEGVRKVG